MKNNNVKYKISIAAAHEGNLSRRVSEEGAEKVYRSEKAAVILKVNKNHFGTIWLFLFSADWRIIFFFNQVIANVGNKF